jgi:PTS system nitrogen regulatory IIA component
MDADIPLSALVERGGILYSLGGNSVDTVLAELTGRLPEYRGNSGFRAALLKAALEREALMSTGAGHGIALPHPRSPMAADGEHQFVTIGFPSRPVDWKALDGKLVHSVLLIVSATPKFHLQTLSKINFLCMDDAFPALLRDRASPGVILQAIRETEQRWKQ